jgi:hypothetical protein
LNLNRLNDDLQRLRGFRNWQHPNTHLSQLIRDACRSVERQHSAAGGIAEAWAEILPPHLTRQAQIVSLARGTLTVRTADASTRYQIDRFLRSGGQAELARRAKVAVTRVKFT